ncbi:AAA family ATPase [Methylocaldum sp.]|uniref:AAA family ATPase n=1 Tax=Methylocaldum sp. TaxID=1969727 RepID=UPI002D27C6D6|nr:AAA family ATPase [Methylocaldum sp.]HYE36270.1 AAA family ATPase [Methylocaldum sp.]
MQKFDLLLHLAVNLAQPIVVCGPEGIGKTTFLRFLETRLAPLATVRYLVSAPGMGYERILDELSRTLNQDKPRSASSGLGLTDLLANYGKEHRNLVLLLDDAGALAPGLLNALWQFASSHPALRLVLAMRSNEALQKSDTDRSALGDAFILDIPALSQDECRFYAHQLATRVSGLPSGQEITESFVKRLYSRSRGVPGAVVEMLKSSHGSTKTAALANFGWVTAAGLLAGVTAYAFFLFFSRQTPEPQRPLPDSSAETVKSNVAIAPSVPEQVQEVEASTPAEPLTKVQEPPASTAVEIVAASQSPSAPLALAESEKTEISKASEPATITATPAAAVPVLETEAKKTAEDPKPMESGAPLEPPPAAVVEEPKNTSETQVQVSSARPEPADSLREAEVKARESGTSMAQGETSQRSKSPEIVMEGLKSAEWLMDQSPEAYTLQIVAVSRLSSVVKLAKQFPLGSELASFRSRKGSGDLYPLFFGIYPTLPAAKEAAATLPVSLGQPLPRQMKSIHQEIRRMMPRHAAFTSSADSSDR